MKAYDSLTKAPKKGEAYYLNCHKLFDGQSRYGRSLTQKRVIGRCKKVARQDGKKEINSELSS